MSLPSAEVAADFKDALQDLKINSRPEISNLTIIAKENTEHAQAISRELENHIKTTRPEWKLPALYVLDSIVKNVGTPYTVYLGRNLYRTFMDAYTLMDMPTRKAMEGLLKTWKQPVPESMDTRPVFTADVTRDIENALIKYRTVAIQQQALSQKQSFQHNVAARPMPNTPWRSTPTPPQNITRYTPSNDPRVRQMPQQFGAPFPPTATPPTPYQPPAHGFHERSSSVDLDRINADLDRLINTAKTDWAANPADTAVQQKLKALFDLQKILKTQQLPPDQIRAVQAQVMQLAPPQPPAPAPQPAAQSQASLLPFLQLPRQQAPPTFPPPSASLDLAQILAQAQARGAMPPAPTPTSLPDIFRQSATPTQHASTPMDNPPFLAPPVSAPPSAPTPTTPDLARLLQQFRPPPSPAVQQPPPQTTPLSQLISQPPPTNDANWLLNALKAQNLIPSTGIPPTPQNVGQNLGSQPMARSESGTAAVYNDAELTTASMKRQRLNLIARLYEMVPNQCVTCGRRFENTPKGKEMKARHMDWHFKVKDAETAKRGVHRSWYINEREWIDYRETDDAAPPQEANGLNNTGGASATKKQTKDKYILVPTDAAVVHTPCPICQEKFEPQWLVEENDFVWMDAVKVNGKIYHATCWEEYSRGSGIGGSVGGRGTPDSVLGKRKAEGLDYEIPRPKGW